MAHDCPECGEPLRTDGSCTSCQYGRKRAPATPRADYQCSNTVMGQRCAKVGIYSPNTMGSPGKAGPHPGPWYCRQHHPMGPYADPRPLPADVKTSGPHVPMPDWFRREWITSGKLAKIGRGVDNPKAWAHRIIERVRNGETLPLLAIENAQAVIASRAKPIDLEAIDEERAERAALQADA